MYQIDNSSVAGALPASTASGTPGYFTDGSPAAAIPATLLPAEFMNSLMLEMLGVLSAAGVAPVKASFNQLALAIRMIVQSGNTSFALGTGTANSYICAFTPAIVARNEGHLLRFKVGNSNTGASTFNDGLGAVALVGGAHSALQGGELVANGDAWVQWNSSIGGGAYILLFCTGAPEQISAGTASGHASTVGQLQSGATNYAKDTGTANTYVVSYSPAISAPVDGMKLGFIAKSASTGASTLAVNGLTALPLLNARYGAMQANQIAIGSICAVQYVQTLNSWVLLSASGNAVPSTLAGYGITDAYTQAQINTLIGTQTKVVGNPVVTGSSSVTSGTVVTLTATANSLLTGGSIASFTWTLPDGTQTTTAATSNSATKAVTATGSIGTNYVVTCIATDNAGNTSQPVTKSIAITNHVAPTAPTTITAASTVYQNSTGNTITVSGSTASDGATLTYSITQSGSVAVTFSKTTNIAANEVVTFTAPAVAADTPITISVTAVDSMGGVSTPKTASVTISAAPSVAGTPYGGGFYFGKIVIAGSTYALVDAGKAAESSRIFGTATTSGNSINDGLANSNALNDSSHPAIQYCRAYAGGGFSDWYLPSQNEQEMLYRYLKPGTYSPNYLYSGANPDSIPVGSNYTAYSPAQTTATAFKTGGAQAFQEPPTSSFTEGDPWYWNSTTGTVSSNTSGIKGFSDGYLQIDSTTYAHIARPIRRIKIS